MLFLLISSFCLSFASWDIFYDQRITRRGFCSSFSSGVFTLKEIWDFFRILLTMQQAQNIPHVHYGVTWELGCW